MLTDNSRHLSIQCGPYAFLIDIACIIEIINLASDKNILEISDNYGNIEKISIHSEEITFFNMHSFLGIDMAEYSNPRYAIVLSDRLSNSPLLAIYVDEVYEIMETDLTGWHEMQGLNNKLDALCDMAYPYKKNDQILLRLNPTQKWLSQDKRATNGY